MENNSQPPLPQPHRLTCNSCGFGWDKSGALCPRCGAAHAEKARNDSQGVMLAYVFGAMLLLMFGVPFVPLVLLPYLWFLVKILFVVWMGLLLFYGWEFFRGGN